MTRTSHRVRESSSRSLKVNALLVVASFLLTLATVEVVLQVAGLLVGHRTPEERLADGVRILAVGDSHTYGVYYDASQAYPELLASLLNDQLNTDVQVVNRGLPGMNSAQIAERLPSWIQTYDPDFIIFCAGINNVWNEAGGSPSWLARMLDRSKVVRLARLLGRAIEDHGASNRPDIDRQLVNEGKDGVLHRNRDSGEVLIVHEGNIRQRSRDLDEAADQLVEDLARVRDVASQQGTQLLLLTYSAFPLPDRAPMFVLHEKMNDTMRAFARENDDVGIVDVGPLFLRNLLSPSTSRSTWFHSDTEGHPNPEGYALIAQSIADALSAEYRCIFENASCTQTGKSSSPRRAENESSGGSTDNGERNET